MKRLELHFTKGHIRQTPCWQETNQASVLFRTSGVCILLLCMLAHQKGSTLNGPEPKIISLITPWFMSVWTYLSGLLITRNVINRRGLSKWCGHRLHKKLGFEYYEMQSVYWFIERWKLGRLIVFVTSY